MGEEKRKGWGLETVCRRSPMKGDVRGDTFLCSLLDLLHNMVTVLGVGGLGALLCHLCLD